MTAPITDQQQYLETPHDQSAAAVLAAYLTASAALRSRLLALVVAAYVAQGNYRDAAADAFVAAVVPAVLAAQVTMAHLTSAYLAHLVSAAGGGTTAPVAIPQADVTNLRGVDPTEVYRRPYVQVWTDLSQGKSLEAAVQAGQRRAVSLASTDVQLAKTRASQIAFANDKRVVGYRRVLVGAHSCGLCVVASSVRYHKSNLMPIHPGCDCAIAPILGTQRIGRTINSAILAEGSTEQAIGSQGMKFFSHDDVIEMGDLLTEAHDAVRDTFGQAAADAHQIDYRKIVMVRDHGELGPTLTVASHDFTQAQIESGDLSAKAGTFHTVKGREVTNIGED
jgi:hypothetical protein